MSEPQRERWQNPLGPEAAGDRARHRAVVSRATSRWTPAEPPRAITTAHPLAHLGWLIKLWIEKIRPAVPEAQLHVYSALLNKGELGAEVPANVKPVLTQAMGAREHGVIDPAAAARSADGGRLSRGARASLSGAGGRAAGLDPGREPGGRPARRRDGVERDHPGAHRRRADRQDRRAPKPSFVSATIDLLTDRASFDRMSANARLLRRGRTWPVAAAEFEEILA